MRQGNCWRCGKPTKSHAEPLFIYTPMGSIREYVFTCHTCYEEVGPDGVAEHKRERLEKVKKSAQEAYDELKAHEESEKHDDDLGIARR